MIFPAFRATAQVGTVVKIALSGDSAPNLVGTIGGGNNPVLSNSGVVAFTTLTLNNERAILTGSGGGLTTIASTHDFAPGPGPASRFLQFSDPAINARGAIAFFAPSISGQSGIYFADGSGLYAIATTNTPNPSFPGNFTVYSDLPGITSDSSVYFNGGASLSTDNGIFEGLVSGGITQVFPRISTQQIAAGMGVNPARFLAFHDAAANLGNGFHSDIAFWGSTSGGNVNSGIYFLHFTVTPEPLATVYDAAPGLGGLFSAFGDPVNVGTQTAFHAFGGLVGGEGIYMVAAGPLTAVATNNNQVAPGLDSTFGRFSDPALSTFGAVAFVATAVNDQSAVYRGLTPVATTYRLAPGLGATFTSFYSVTINGSGCICFGGGTASGSGIYLGDGTDLVVVAYQGQGLQGSTISALTPPTFIGGPNRGGRSGFNDNGQVAFSTLLTNGKSGTFLFTPILHYRTAASGNWDGGLNFTLGQPPGPPHDVFIDPATALTVMGPFAPTSVRSLLINGSGAGVAELALQLPGFISTTNGLTIGQKGLLTGPGTINGSVTINAGGVATANSGTLTFNGNTINQGVVRMTGGATFINNGTFQNNGVIDVITGNFTPQPGFTNNGTILDKSLVKVKQLTKNGAGVIVTIDGYTGHTYQLQRSGSLSTDTFTNVGSPVAGITGQPIQFADVFGASDGFYRVVVF